MKGHHLVDPIAARRKRKNAQRRIALLSRRHALGASELQASPKSADDEGPILWVERLRQSLADCLGKGS